MYEMTKAKLAYNMSSKEKKPEQNRGRAYSTFTEQIVIILITIDT